LSDNIVRAWDDAAAPDEDTEIDERTLPSLDIDIDVTFQKKRFTVLHLREPKAKEVERAERELTEKTQPYHVRLYQARLIAQVAEVPIEVIGELPYSTVTRAWRFLARKLGIDSPETGETS
jgi:tail assembly chaperone E/41/14-like protein